MLRKLTAVASLLALLVTSTLFLTGCNKGNTDNAASGGGTAKRRIILLTNGDDPFWDAMREGMNAAAKELDRESAAAACYRVRRWRANAAGKRRRAVDG